jgi:succinate dehydrogenase / fumarate reductase flavoprotein subunit
MTKLVVENGRCVGVVIYDLATGQILPIRAKAVIFATGGYGRVYLRTTNAYINHGSGIGMAYRAGVALKDMEFVQFHPTAIYPKNILITEAARGEGGHLVNNKGQRFMADYAPKAMELAPRDIVARAIQTEVDKGNGFEDEYVHLDLRHLGQKKIDKRLPSVREICIKFGGLDPVETPIPIQPAQHYSMGGIDVDVRCATALPGFYAAGECACVSVHGANRLGGNSLLDTVVFGKFAGQEASNFVQGLERKNGDEKSMLAEAAAEKAKVDGWLSRPGGKMAHHLLNDLKIVMSDKAGIFRTKKQLEEALEAIREIREDYGRAFISGQCLRYSQAIVNLIEFGYMVDLTEVITLGALLREETRGSHYRLDFPKREDAGWLKHTLVNLRDGKPEVTYRDVQITKYQPQERKY